MSFIKDTFKLLNSIHALYGRNWRRNIQYLDDALFDLMMDSHFEYVGKGCSRICLHHLPSNLVLKINYVLDSAFDWWGFSPEFKASCLTYANKIEWEFLQLLSDEFPWMLQFFPVTSSFKFKSHVLLVQQNVGKYNCGVDNKFGSLVRKTLLNIVYDLHPENILNKNGFPVVVDWGMISKHDQRKKEWREIFKENQPVILEKVIKFKPKGYDMVRTQIKNQMLKENISTKVYS